MAIPVKPLEINNSQPQNPEPPAIYQLLYEEPMFLPERNQWVLTDVTTLEPIELQVLPRCYGADYEVRSPRADETMYWTRVPVGTTFSRVEVTDQFFWFYSDNFNDSNDDYIDSWMIARCGNENCWNIPPRPEIIEGRRLSYLEWGSHYD